MGLKSATDLRFMRLALRLARKAYGQTSPNPLVGAVLVKRGKIIGQGWHHRAGQPHAEVEALQDAARRGAQPRGATLYVTLEPCCTHGRTPPCTDAVMQAGIKRVVVAATDPNPQHAGHGLALLRQAGLTVETGLLAAEASRLNEAFQHWIVRRTPFVTVKAAMSLDGKIATASGESKWITGPESRAHAMHLRQGSDAILVGVNTVLADDPSLTVRFDKPGQDTPPPPRLRRLILDARARTPLAAKVVSDASADLTTIVVSRQAPARRVAALAKKVRVWMAPLAKGSAKGEAPRLDLDWLLRKLGEESVASLLVEGGGEVNASFLLGGLAHRVAFFYAPKIIGGRAARKGVAGAGIAELDQAICLEQVEYRWLGPDLLLTALVRHPATAREES